MLFLFKIVPIPSICPETKCPPNRPFATIARSKFTLECGLSMRSDVDCIVSGIASTVNEVVVKLVTVKQIPLTAILSPK